MNGQCTPPHEAFASRNITRRIALFTDKALTAESRGERFILFVLRSHLPAPARENEKRRAPGGPRPGRDRGPGQEETAGPGQEETGGPGQEETGGPGQEETGEPGR